MSALPEGPRDGLFHKFRVERIDGRDQPGGDRDKARYFVLDYAQDPFAGPALLAYADACEVAEPGLAADLRAAVARGHIMTAVSALIRQHVEALPNWARDHWKRHREFINTKGDWPLAECGPPSDGLNPALLAEYIVTIASPPVATALADLLDAIDAWRESHEELTGREFVRAGRVLLADRDLRAAISRSEQPR